MRGVPVTVTAAPNVAVSSVTPPMTQVGADGKLVSASDVTEPVVFVTLGRRTPSSVRRKCRAAASIPAACR